MLLDAYKLSSVFAIRFFVQAIFLSVLKCIVLPSYILLLLLVASHKAFAHQFWAGSGSAFMFSKFI
jgi:hypothetical protein